MSSKSVPQSINAAEIRLRLDGFGRLVLCAGDDEFVGVEPIRAFPISDPERWVSFCNHDGREVYCLESIGSLAPETRKLLESELAMREFVPVIERIERVSGEGTPSDWEVTTDRGPTRFTLDNEEDLRALSPTRILITDARKLRYQIPDIHRLDSASRRMLERYL